MAIETITSETARIVREPDSAVRLENLTALASMNATMTTEQAYNALCLEQEKQAALIGVLKQSLKDGLNGMAAERMYEYLTVMVDQQKAQETAAMTLYETAVAHE